MKMSTLVILGVTWMKFQRPKAFVAHTRSMIPQLLNQKVLLRPAGTWHPGI